MEICPEKIYQSAAFWHHSIKALQKSDKKSDVAFEETTREDENNDDEKRSIKCRFCQNEITTHDKRIKINGSYVHKFINPSGIMYEIGCFGSASGCLVIGNPTREFTWFPGYSWSFAVCSKCHSHMGWLYQSNGSGFFGLILENLEEL